MQLESVFDREAREAAEREAAMRRAEAEAMASRLTARLGTVEHRIERLREQLARLDAIAAEAERRAGDPLAASVRQAVEGVGWDPAGCVRRVAAEWGLPAPVSGENRPTLRRWLTEYENERRDLRTRLKQADAAHTI
jgi:hypothetical protein